MPQKGYIHNDNASAPNAVHVSEAFQTQVRAKTTGNNVNPNVQPARWSTAPYKRRKRDSPGAELCQVNDCNAFATKRWPGLCAGHGRWGKDHSGNIG